MSSIKLKVNDSTFSIDMDDHYTLQDAMEQAVSSIVMDDEDQNEILESIDIDDYVIIESEGLVSYFVKDGKLNDDFFDCRDNDLDENIKMSWLENDMEWDADQITECYQGYFVSDKNFVQELIENTGDDLPAYIHIDWESTARDIMMDYFESNWHYFKSV